MRLEPISERAPQHARCGARRAALHHVVLAVEKIYGIAWIEWHGRKPRKRRELRPRPLPPVPDKIVHAESARSRWVHAHRRGIPRFEIEISPGRAWRFLAPRICALPRSVGRSICGAMKLRLGRQFASQPLRIRRGLCVAHVYRPFLRQTYLVKHRAINPEVALAPPEHRMLDAFLGLPGPGFVTPKRTVLVTPRLHKPQEFVVRHVVVVDGKLVHLGFMRAKFVVPPEFIPVSALQSQRYGSSRDFHQMRLYPERLPCRSLGTDHLSGRAAAGAACTRASPRASAGVQSPLQALRLVADGLPAAAPGHARSRDPAHRADAGCSAGPLRAPANPPAYPTAIPHSPGQCQTQTDDRMSAEKTATRTPVARADSSQTLPHAQRRKLCGVSRE